MIVLFSCGLILLWSQILAPSVFGQVSIVPLIQEISVNRGGKTGFQLQIANRGTETLAFSMHTYNLGISEEGVPSVNQEETQWSCMDWITFSPNTFELEVDKIQIVDGLVRAPKDAEGGYYAFITCEFSVPSGPFNFGKDNKSQVDIQLARAVSSVLLVTARSSKNHVQLEPDSLFLASGKERSKDIELSPNGQETGNNWQVNLAVVNTGNVHTVAMGDVSIWTEGARLVERAQLLAGRGYILPGKRRLFKAQGTKRLEDGIYMVKAQLRTKDGKLVQGAFPYSIVKGEAIPGAASDAIRALMEASAPPFSLSTNLLDFGITPGGNTTKGIRLTNYTPDTLSVSARLVNWSMNDSGMVTLNPDPKNIVKPCLSWVTVSPEPLLLPPKGSGSAKINVNAPAEINGEYYTAIIFETSKTGKMLPTEFELARTLFVTVSFKKNLEYKASISSVSYDPISPMMRAFVVNVENVGNVHCFTQGEIEIYDKKYNLMMEPIAFGSSQDYLLPERIRGYVVPCPGALAPGTYEAVIKVKYNEESEPAISKFNFVSKAK